MADGAYIDYRDKGNLGPLGVKLELTGKILEGTVGYQLEKYPAFDLIGGVRYFDIETCIQLSPLPNRTSEKDWADPFISARYTQSISESCN